MNHRSIVLEEDRWAKVHCLPCASPTDMGAHCTNSLRAAEKRGLNLSPGHIFTSVGGFQWADHDGLKTPSAGNRGTRLAFLMCKFGQNRCRSVNVNSALFSVVLQDTVEKQTQGKELLCADCTRTGQGRASMFHPDCGVFCFH